MSIVTFAASAVTDDSLPDDGKPAAIVKQANPPARADAESEHSPAEERDRRFVLANWPLD